MSGRLSVGNNCIVSIICLLHIDDIHWSAILLPITDIDDEFEV